MKQRIDAILGEHKKRLKIIPSLQDMDIQKNYLYLPKEELSYVAKMLNVGKTKVYFITAFYEDFKIA